jgi:acyl-CoA thioester hydrolase
MLTSYRFFYPLRVRYSEIDGQKIVFNAHYLTYIDLAIIEYFRKVLGEHWLELADSHVFDIALVKLTLDFKKSAKLDDMLHIYCGVSRIGNSSFTVGFSILRGETEVILTAEAIYVNYNSGEGKSQSIPAEIRRKILLFEGREEG